MARPGAASFRLSAHHPWAVPAPLPRCVAEPTHERLYLAQTDRIDTRQLPRDIQPAMS